MEDQIQNILSTAHFRPLRQVLAETFGGEAAIEMQKEIKDQLRVLLEQHANDEPQLAEESHNYILPSIAIYKRLREETGSARALDIFRKIYFAAAYDGAQRLRDMAKDAEFRKAFPHKNAHNKNGDRVGFSFRLIKDDEGGAEYHVLRCPYCDYCARYQCGELVPIFCECDDIFYGSIHPQLHWGRTMTLGRGDDLCNFKFTHCEEA